MSETAGTGGRVYRAPAARERSLGRGVPLAGHVWSVMHSPGRALETGVRSDMEARFGHSFGAVRAHTDAEAAGSVTAAGAQGYAIGQHVVFGPGRFAPATTAGRRLIAHELAHTLQQPRLPLSAPTDLTMSRPGDAAERAADAAAGAALEGQQPREVASTSLMLARQAAGVPPAGPVVRSVQIENQAAAIAYPVPSILGPAGRSHWVTLAGSRPDVVISATLDPAVAAGDPAAAALIWESDPPGTATPGADALHVTTSVPAATRRRVRASLGGSHAELTLWAVFVWIDSPGPANPVAAHTAGPPAGLSVATPAFTMTGTIHPATIITDADRPDLAGANTVPPPNGFHVCGTPLNGGADHRWDMSRQARARNVDPAGLVPALQAAFAQGCLLNPTPYPAEREVGNDDTGTGDENDDPYAGGGIITSMDHPTWTFDDGVGAAGDTVSVHWHFREFARLEFHRTWWNVSRFFPWRVHLNVIKGADGQWHDNASDAALDNAGF